MEETDAKPAVNQRLPLAVRNQAGGEIHSFAWLQPAWQGDDRRLMATKGRQYGIVEPLHNRVQVPQEMKARPGQLLFAAPGNVIHDLAAVGGEHEFARCLQGRVDFLRQVLEAGAKVI